LKPVVKFDVFQAQSGFSGDGTKLAKPRCELTHETLWSEDMNKLIVMAVLGLSSMSVMAAVVPVPAPDTLPLIAIGAISGLVVWAAKRNKKK